MDELQKRGGKLIYDPQLAIARRPRSNLKAFARMLQTYGRGRAEQVRLHPTFGSAPNFVPPLFLLYVATTIAVLAWSPQFGRVMLLPLGFYGLVVLAQAAILSAKAPLLRSLAAVPLIVLTHLLYGWGFLRGLFTRLNAPADRAAVPVEIEEIEPLGSNRP